MSRTNVYGSKDVRSTLTVVSFLTMSESIFALKKYMCVSNGELKLFFSIHLKLKKCYVLYMPVWNKCLMTAFLLSPKLSNKSQELIVWN